MNHIKLGVVHLPSTFMGLKKMMPLRNLIVEKASRIFEEFEVCPAFKDAVLLCCNYCCVLIFSWRNTMLN